MINIRNPPKMSVQDSGKLEAENERRYINEEISKQTVLHVYHIIIYHDHVQDSKGEKVNDQLHHGWSKWIIRMYKQKTDLSLTLSVVQLIPSLLVWCRNAGVRWSFTSQGNPKIDIGAFYKRKYDVRILCQCYNTWYAQICFATEAIPTPYWTSQGRMGEAEKGWCSTTKVNQSIFVFFARQRLFFLKGSDLVRFFWSMRCING